jgi:hypothetical protein
MIPVDHRRYKSSTIQAHLDTCTFKPKLNRISKKIASHHYKQIQGLVALEEKSDSQSSEGVQEDIISISIHTGQQDQKSIG